MDEHYLSRAFPSSLQVAKLTAVSLNSEGPLARQRVLSRLTDEKAGTRVGKNICDMHVCMYMCLFLRACVRRDVDAAVALDLSCERNSQLSGLEGSVPAHCPCMESLRLS